jgi:DNA-binding response OmpR family regulator
MNYKIVSTNHKLIEKITLIINSLNMKESIHIQEVDLWIVDVQTIDDTAILSYKNKINYSNILFIVNNSSEVKLCLDNSFLHYINISFDNQELISWCKYFAKNKKDKTIKIDNHTSIDLNNSIIIQDNIPICLTAQEKALINELFSFKFISTTLLANALKVSSTTSIRTIINRIRKKLKYDIFEQKKTFGYKLKTIEEKQEPQIKKSAIEELKEQNTLMQNVIDSSPIFIVTFIHKQLYCINKSFRDYLGTKIIQELWEEENGDFFQLIEHDINKTDILKETLFTKGKHAITLYKTNNNKTSFEIETFYFENLDKHLFVFKSI